MMVRASTVRDDVGFGLPPVVSHSGLAGRLACLFAVAVLLCVSSAQGQVIEEGGFPVKGGGVSGESFSLSCPPRLIAQAGESVALSCSATGVPEEGVRYGWESVSGEGFYLLSASDELSPLFTAPLSGAGEEYAYRLTAMAAGVYRTATVTVTVEGVPGETVGAPVVREECDSFTVPDELGEGCVEDKGPAPFGFGSEAEGGFLFPEAPGLPDRPSGPVRGGGSVMQAPPRLECPVAIFLEELETGSIECRVFDASGEEHLEYAWEPVGSTTRDYLENPRLIPEDSPTPSVVAPEAPAYETLDDARSGGTSAVYRYRLTATSRATGLSSRTEVEVFVSGSRPGVYCPLEVAVEEGATIALDCEGVDPLSGRMDYDEDGASIEWEWEGLWGTSTALLDATDRSSPLFTAPPGSSGEAYHYIASMTSQASGVSRTARRRVTVTVTGQETEAHLSMPNYEIFCNGTSFTRYAGSDDISLSCWGSGSASFGLYRWLWVTWSADGPPQTAPSFGGYPWSPPAKLSLGFSAGRATFNMPATVDSTTTYRYTIGVWAGNNGQITFPLFKSQDITITVRHADAPRPVALACADPSPVYEGTNDFDLDCAASGAPAGSTYDYVWTARDDTPDTALLIAGMDGPTPTFAVPEEVAATTTYEYLLTVSADNAEDAEAEVAVQVLNKASLSAVCTNAFPEVYEGTNDFDLDCAASGAPAGSTYDYVWTARDDTPDTALLIAGMDGPTPTFAVPEEVAATTTYEYLLTVSADNAEDAEAEVAVQVLNKASLSAVCTNAFPEVYEGTDDFELDCSASGAPAGSTYDYVWTARDDTPDTALLIAGIDGPTPTFAVPEEVAATTTYEYLLTVSADNAEDAEAEVAVQVLNKASLSAVCTNAFPEVYEGTDDFELDCSASGAPAGSTYDYVWTARDDTPDTALLIAGMDGPTPTFAVPEEVAATTTYEYLLTVSADNAEDAEAEVAVQVLNKASLSAVCTNAFPEVYEGTDDFELDCSASGAPAGSTYDYVWTARDDTPDTALLIAGMDGPTPTFAVPEEVAATTTYEYLLTVSADNAEDAEAEVAVQVLNKASLSAVCTNAFPEVYEGTDDFELDCSASGAPAGSTYDYVWTARDDTPDTALLIAGIDGPTPTFAVPEEVAATTTYEYLLTVSAANAEDGTANVTVTVLNKGALAVVCVDPSPAYEGADDIALDCSASGAPGDNPEYTYAWEARGDTPETALLIAGIDGPTPTFAVPDEVAATTTYEYLLTVSAANAEDGTANVTVTVLNKGALAVVCVDPSPAYEGAADFDLDCSASGAPAGSTYDYVWTARDDTPDTALLITGIDGPAPTFAVPDEVVATTTYEYLLTVSAEHAESGSAEVTVTVLNKGALAVVCVDPSPAYEGAADFDLDCSASGAPAGSTYDYVWTARDDTPDTALLIAGIDGPAPTFAVPDEVVATTTYEYLLTVSAEHAESGSAEVTVTVLNHGALRVVCVDPPSVYEGSSDIALDCSASGAPGDNPEYTYAWEARGDTPDTALLIAGIDGPIPTFAVPEEVAATTTYEYLLTVSAEHAESGSAEVTVTVLNHGALRVVCVDPPSVYEGSEDIALDCSASGAPGDNPEYTYAWEARGDTPDTALLIADIDGPTPTFAVPDEVAATTTYEYLLTVSAEHAESGSAEVTVTVLNHGALRVVCVDPPSVYEGSEDVALDCSASGAPGDNPEYTYAWEARGDTPDTALLIADIDGPTPTFAVPDEVAATTTYEYLLTVSAEHAESGSAEVTVTVLNHGALRVVCVDPPSVYEGSEDVALDCSASGAPGDNPEYAYAWEARGDTPDTALLIAGIDGPTPTFAVPEEVAATTTYEYLLTVSAEHAESGSAEVTVTVLNHGALRVVCVDPPSVYEGSEDVALDCSASGAPGDNPEYAYAWEARGDTPDTALLIAGIDGPTPTFAVPEEVAATTTYEYLLTVSAANAEDGSANVTVTVLNHGALRVVCVDPPSVYEGSEDVALDCSASGAPGDNPEYAYAWEARGDTPDTALLIAGIDGPTPTFAVPDEVAATTTYEYLLTVSAANAEDGTANVTVTVLNKGALAVVCVDPSPAYEGADDIALDCSASGAPGDNPEYAYAWEARGDTPDTALLIVGIDGPTPTFAVPEEVAATTTYEYLLTVSAANAEDGTANVTVTVLNKGALAVVCVDPSPAYEGADDIALDCSASGAPGDNPEYAYAWEARGDTPDTALLIVGIDGPTPTFAVPEEVAATTTYEYLLTVSAANAEDGTANVTVTVLDRVLPPVADSSPRATESSAPGLSEASSLGVTVSTSSLRFGVQSADTQVSLDPMTDGISTRVSGPYHAGRMTLSPGSSEATDESGEMDLSIELASPVVLRREGGIEAASIVLAPLWSLSESCEQLSSQTIGGLYTEVTLAGDACRLLRFGGELDLTDVPSGRYAGGMDVVLRSGESEETHSVEVDVTVVPAQRVITIGPGGVRFSTSRELPAGLTEEQNLSIYPDVAFMTREKPHGAFELSNPSLIPLEVTVSARFGYTEATENGREVVAEDTSGSHLGDLSQVVDIRPGVLVLMPGEKGLVRYGVKEGALAAMAEKGYAAFFDVVSEPRQYVRTDQMPEKVTGDRTARVTMRVPGVYVPGEGASQLRAALLSISYVGSLSATFLLETADRPFAGEVVAYDGDGRELGRRETLVYTRSRVRVPLDRMPEEGAVFLRFMPRGSGRAPEPASVEWDAPRRDIGAAEDKDRTATPETLARKP